MRRYQKATERNSEHLNEWRGIACGGIGRCSYRGIILSKLIHKPNATASKCHFFLKIWAIGM